MNVKTPKFKASYPNLFKSRTNELNGKQEYSVVALFEKGADLSELKKAAQEAIVKKWGADKAKWPTNLKSPFRDQGEKKKEGKPPQGYEEGAIFMTFKTEKRPGIVNASLEEISDESEIYPGVVLRASVRAYAYDRKGNRGVAFGLSNIQKIAEGESLGGFSRPEDDFEPIKTEATEAAATATDLFN